MKSFKDAPLRVAIVGAGYWGPNLIRNFNNVDSCDVTIVIEKNMDRWPVLREMFPDIVLNNQLSRALQLDIDAVVIATPLASHYYIARQALLAGKHVFVEKPMAATSEEAGRLCAIASEKDLVLMVGHTFLYNDTLNKIRDALRGGEYGQFKYAHIQRLNLGLFRDDCNVSWDLAAHDIALLNHLIGEKVIAVNAVGRPSDIDREIDDVAFINLHYPGNKLAHIHVSWLDPNKVRTVTVVASKKMVVYDDMGGMEKMRIYDKGMDAVPMAGVTSVDYRHGDIVIPRTVEREPLRNEVEQFIKCIEEGTTPTSDGYLGYNVVATLEAIDESIRFNGMRVRIKDST